MPGNLDGIIGACEELLQGREDTWCEIWERSGHVVQDRLGNASNKLLHSESVAVNFAELVILA